MNRITGNDSTENRIRFTDYLRVEHSSRADSGQNSELDSKKRFRTHRNRNCTKISLELRSNSSESQSPTDLTVPR